MTQFLVLVGIGAVCLALGWLLLTLGRGRQGKVNLLKRVPTSTAKDVPALLPGEMVELKGTLRSDAPLTSNIAKRPCAYYASKVTREYEERERNSKGDWQTHRRSETISEDKQAAPFYVEDASGRVLVHPDGAEIDAQQVVDRFEPVNESGGLIGPSITFGGVTLNLGSTDSGTKTLGYRYEERILATDMPIYVLGAVQEGGDIGAPRTKDSNRRFIISYRSEEALQTTWSKQARWLAAGAISLFAAGAILVVAGLVTLVV